MTGKNDRTAHSLGLRTTATMNVRCGEELRHRVNHLERLRRIQEDTGGLPLSFPGCFRGKIRALARKSEKLPRRLFENYSRQPLYFDNFDPHPVELAHTGHQVCQVGLACSTSRIHL